MIGRDGPDPYEVHVGRVLTAAEVASLAAGKPSAFRVAAPAAGVPGGKWVTDRPAMPEEGSNVGAFGVKPRLAAHWRGLHAGGGGGHGDFRSEQQAQFFSLCNSYRDVYHSRRPCPQGRVGTPEEETAITDAYLLHVVSSTTSSRQGTPWPRTTSG